MENDFSKFKRMNDKTFKNYIPTNQEEIKFYDAYKRVKRIKGFYTHATVYVVVNCMIIIAKIQKIDEGEGFFEFKNFSTALFWGLGLLAHGLSVFLPNFILGNNWEEKRIKEMMDKEKTKQNKWS